MTNEEIISRAQTILYDSERAGTFSHEDIGILSAAIGLGRIALRDQKEQKRNDPLTLAELREMGGEPVYIHSDIFPGDCGWRVVKATEVLYIQFTDGDCFRFTDYGKSWLAYRHKPGEDDHE